jgi:hypothetical protein
MNYKDILRYNRELRLCNIQNISTRLLAATNGNMFIAFNVLHQVYEVHTVRSFQYNGVSLNATLDDDMVGAWIYKDIRSYNAAEMEDARKLITHLREKNEEWLFKFNTENGLRSVERNLGRKL